MQVIGFSKDQTDMVQGDTSKGEVFRIVISPGASADYAIFRSASDETKERIQESLASIGVASFHQYRMILDIRAMEHGQVFDLSDIFSAVHSAVEIDEEDSLCAEFVARYNNSGAVLVLGMTKLSL